MVADVVEPAVRKVDTAVNDDHAPTATVVAATDHDHAQKANEAHAQNDVTSSSTTSTTATTTASVKKSTSDATVMTADTATQHKTLPVGQDVDPAHQREALQKASDDVVLTQVDKLEADERERLGKPEGSSRSYIPGMDNDKLWTLRRRFDTQVLHVLSPPTKLPPGQPDLRPTTLPNVPFNSDLLRSNVERCYATAGVWSIYFAREMMRLMSWSPQDRHRTAAFATAYFVAWWFSMVLPLVSGFCIILIMFRPSRKFFFPPIPPPPGQPPSATDPTNTKGDESMLAGVGHPVEHRSKAEQIEQQAYEFSNVIQRFSVRVVVGGHHKGSKGNGDVGKKAGLGEEYDLSSSDDDDDEELDQLPKIENQTFDEDKPVLAEKEDGTVKELSARQKRKLKAREAKAKRDAQVGHLARGAQDALGDLADALERFANALSPPRPYPPNQARAKLSGAIFVPIMLVTAVVPAHVWSQLASFGFGVAFFGQPLLIRAAKWFIKTFPDWQEKIDLRNSIFSGVPTNAQLTLHVLRVAEASFDPLPAPPPPPTPEHVQNEISKTGFDPESPPPELKLGPDGKPITMDKEHQQGHEQEEEQGVAGGGVGSAVVNTGKKTLFGTLRLAARKAATFRADVAVDGTKQKVGNKIDRFFYQSRAKDPETPEAYPAKLHGTSGHLILTSGPDTQPTLSFVPLRSSLSKPSFQVKVEDLVEVKKKGVFIARAVLGWAASINLEGMGLDMRFKSIEERQRDSLGQGKDPHSEDHEGDTWSFSHVGRRDQLFARLLSVCGQTKWEML
ncbi:hypothetical protein OIO90_002372 [Microbotryomycetes sp. JL221]|nr:hypothetical protein OIO90_002372 [Microbotryomycetes sp. JL221]